MSNTGAALLLLDTCAERATLAVTVGTITVQAAELPPKGASAGLLPAIRRLLLEAGVELSALRGIGVVSGPGSFTGVRVGMAVAKGLSLSSGVPLAAVSRLAVLAETAGLQDGFAVLGAGREDVYVREQGSHGTQAERMMSVPELLEIVQGREVVGVAGEDLPQALPTRRVVLSAACARGLVERELTAAPAARSQAPVDANYVRSEQGIYRARAGVVVDAR